MVTTTRVMEFKDEGIAIIEDTAGKYVVTKSSTDILPIQDYEKQYANQSTCALLQSRSAMLT